MITEHFIHYNAMKKDHMCGKEIHHVNNNITRLRKQNAEQENKRDI